MTKIIAYVDTTFEIELDEEGEMLFRDGDYSDGFDAYLAERIKVSAESITSHWKKDDGTVKS